MIHSEVFNCLNEDELGLLLFGLNTFFPICAGQITPNLLKSYKIDILRQQIAYLKGTIKPEFYPIYNNLCAKFEVSVQ